MNDYSSFKSIRFQLNRESREAKVEPHLLLSDFLRDHLGLKGTRKSCEVEICGACTVLVDGRPVSSCATLAFEIDGKTVTTIEGLAEGDKLHPIQRAFWEQGGFECGYCTPGMILLAYSLLTENPQPSDEEIKHWLSSNLCRCTGVRLDYRGDQTSQAAHGWECCGICVNRNEWPSASRWSSQDPRRGHLHRRSF